MPEKLHEKTLGHDGVDTLHSTPTLRSRGLVLDAEFSRLSRVM